MEGKYVIVRGDRSGVFAGTLVKRNGREVELKQARRLWRWEGATECVQIAMEGVKKPRGCRFTMEVEDILIIDAVEVIPATEEAEKCIKAVPVWKM